VSSHLSVYSPPSDSLVLVFLTPSILPIIIIHSSSSQEKLNGYTSPTSIETDMFIVTPRFDTPSCSSPSENCPTHMAGLHNFAKGRDFFLYATMPTPVLRPIQPHIQGALGVKRQGHEADHSPPLPHTSAWHGA
jgi:hypothetical protein